MLEDLLLSEVSYPVQCYSPVVADFYGVQAVPTATAPKLNPVRLCRVEPERGTVVNAIKLSRNFLPW
jgi:hypothetical protein